MRVILQHSDRWYSKKTKLINIWFQKKNVLTIFEIFIGKRAYFSIYFNNFRLWVGRRMGIFPERTASLQTTTVWTGPRSTWYNPSNTLSMDSAALSTDPTIATATSPSWDQVRTHSDTLIGLDFIQSNICKRARMGELWKFCRKNYRKNFTATSFLRYKR